MSDHLKQLASQLLGQLHRNIKQAQRQQAEWAQRREPPGPGDILLLSDGVAPCHWLLVQTHPQLTSLFFAVPADDHPATGPADVRASEAEGNWTLRTGFSLWLPLDLIPKWVFVGRVGAATLRQVRHRIQQLVQGELQPAEKQRLAILDPDYYFLLDLVEQIHRNTLDFVEKLGTVYHWSLLEPTPPKAVSELARRFFPPDQPENVAPRWLTVRDQEGLYLAISSQGLQVLAVPKTPEPPRVLLGKRLLTPRWTRGLSDCWLSKVWPWPEGPMQLRIRGSQSGWLFIYR